MSHDLELILTLTGALTTALAFGLVAQKLRLSPIVGYLFAGVVVGPFTPGFTAHGAIANQFAELGIILLLFGVGLNLHVRELLGVRRVAVPGALVAIAVAIGGGAGVATLLGWRSSSALVYGLTISVASTVVVLRVFADQQLLHTPVGHVAVGWLLVEDLYVVIVVILLPLLAGERREGGATDVAIAVAVALSKVAALVALTLTVGRKLIGAVLGSVARTRSRELFTLTVLVLALGVAVGSAKLFGASMALGAFLAGLVVGQSDFSSRAASEALPMRDAFAVLFFVATGMLLDPSKLLSNLPLTLLTLSIIVLAKPLAAGAVVLARGYPPRTAVGLAMGVAQIGEFTFVLAALGGQLRLLPPEATQSLVAASILTIAVNPLLFRFVDPAARWVGARLPERKHGPDSLAPPRRHADRRFRAIVVGHGPVGRSLSRLLVDHGLEPTIVELNHDTVAQVRASGLRAVYGDASQREILERAGVGDAGSLIFTASGSPDAVIRTARALNEDLLIVARATRLGEVPPLRRAGAHDVVSAEGEVALAMTERLLVQLGASGEQLDRARARVRKDIADEGGGSHASG